MTFHQLVGGSTAALIGVGAMLASVGGAQAAMLPPSRVATAYVQNVDCAVGAHLGPLGACILGNDDPPPVVVEHRAVEAPVPANPDGCATKSVTRTDGAGNSETHTQTNC